MASASRWPEPCARSASSCAVHRSRRSTCSAAFSSSAEGSPEKLHYDQLVLCAGSALQLPVGARTGSVHAVDSYEQAVALQAAIAGLGDRFDADYRAIVVGAGFTGVEVAAELAGTLRAAAIAAGRTPPPAPVELLGAGHEVAPEFGPAARTVIRGALEKLGVVIRTGVTGSFEDDGSLRIGDEIMSGELIVWACGPRASELNAQLGTPLDSCGRVAVDEQLAAGIDGVWVAGDCARASVDGEHLALMSCQQAIPQGRTAGANAAAVALGLRPERYRQPLYIGCLDLGDAGALLTSGFARNRVLSVGEDAKRFKRFINRSLIYPPADDAKALLRVGRTKPPGRAVSAIQARALRSARVRAAVSTRAGDASVAYGTLEDS